MSSQKPDKPTSSAESLRRLESLPASTAGGSLNDLTPLPGRPEESGPPQRPWSRYLLVLAGLLLLGLFFWMTFTGPKGNRRENRIAETESNIDAARNSLVESCDPGTCRIAITQFNAELARDPSLKPSSLSAEAGKKLQDLVGFSDDGLSEIDGSVYSRLDAAYLEQCLLFRDVARSFDPSHLPGVPAGTLRERWLDRVRLAFAWVVRQVRLEEDDEIRRRVDPLTLPPGYVLRRGIGSPLERALVFLALLEQMGPADRVRGCLIFCPEKAGAEPTLWACGVLLDGKDPLYLFDPRPGLPLPGKEGQGVATLGELVKDPTLLRPLTDAGPYTPAGDQLGKAEIRPVVSLSALAPRQIFLQDRLLGSMVPVRLSQDAEAARTAFEAAARAAGVSSKIAFWTEGRRTTPEGELNLNGAEVLRRFVPEAEGGSDRKQFLAVPSEFLADWLLIPRGARVPPQGMLRQQAWQLSSVPFRYYPRVFTDPERFPRGVGLGERVYSAFAGPFMKAQFESNQPRDQILRGRFTQAIPGLIVERDDLLKAKAALEREAQNPEGLGKRLGEWLDAVTLAYAEQVQAGSANNTTAQAAANRKIEDLWKKGEAVLTLLVGSLATPRLQQISHQVALCKHEVAEAAQMRLDLARAVGVTLPEAEKKIALQAWRDALNWWDRYAGELRNGPDSAAVRRLRARALSCVGNPEQAVSLLRDATPPILPMEQIAMTYLANTLKP